MDPSLGTDSQDSEDLLPPGLTPSEYDTSKISMPKQSLVTTPTSSSRSSKSTGIGVQNAKKKLRAFSIQKKSTITAVSVPKPVNTGSATVLIGKLSSVKTTPKPDKDVDAEKKPPKPPKPGSYRKNVQGSYTALQKRTLCEIEDMKRKMELVDLGIPLGLICPSSTSEKAMPTKAMPPIKSFLASIGLYKARSFRVFRSEKQKEVSGANRKRAKELRKRKIQLKNKRMKTHPSKVDELIREAKKARAAGKEFKFDYQKLLPDYDNPFQRKKDELYVYEKEKREEEYISNIRSDSRKEEYDWPERRKSDKWYDKKLSDYEKHDIRDEREKDKHREETEKYKHREETEKYRHRDETERIKPKEKEEVKKDEPKKSRKETDVILSEYVVCDSWSLENEDKIASSPQVDKAIKPPEKEKPKEHVDISRDNLKKNDSKSTDSPVNKPKMAKLKPVIDAFKFDIDPNEEDEALDVFDEECSIEKFPKSQSKKDSIYDSPIDLKLFDYDQDMSKDIIDANDDNFLESVINEIKQENMSDDTSQDNSTRVGLVEYDSPKEDDDEFRMDASQGSVTPELDDRMRDLQSSQQSHYSDGYRSTESGYKSTESGYKSTESGYKSTESGYKSTESYKSDYKPKDSRHRAESRQSGSFRSSEEKDLNSALERKMSRSTVDSLETWSFVLKICQPLLFRHDKNKCYKETHTTPKLWYTANPKACDCVMDRSVVYEELEMCKMSLVDRVYGCDQIPEAFSASSRAWYPRVGCVGGATSAPNLSTDWETDEPPRSTTPLRQDECLDREYQSLSTDWETDEPPRSTTPLRQDECLDREYQRFIESVWPDVAEPKPETRSTTPDKSVGKESRKKKKAEDGEKDAEDKKKAKKMKLSSEGWSQESDLEEGVDKTKKIKTEKEKIRKRKHSTSSSDSDSEKDSKKKKKIKKKGLKKSKVKMAKKRRVSKKIKKKLKEKQKKKKKIEKIAVDCDKEEKDKKKEKKLKKKSQMKAKKTQKKKKAKPVSSSSSSSSDSSSSTDSELEEQRKKIKKKGLLLKKKKKDKKKKRKESSESTQSEDLFDVNILKNIKTERLTDDEKNQHMNDFSPRRQKNTTKEREIINVKELQNDFVGNNIHIKQEKEEIVKEAVTVVEKTVEKPATETNTEQKPTDVPELVEKKDKDVDNKAKISVSPEPLSPDILFPEESQIPLPDETRTSHSSTTSQLQEQGTIHLTADSNIPLPAEIKTQNIPEPPPQIIEEKVVKSPCVKITEEKVVKTPCVKIIEEKVVKTPCVKIIEDKVVKTPCVKIIEDKVVKTPGVKIIEDKIVKTPCVKIIEDKVVKPPCVKIIEDKVVKTPGVKIIEDKIVKTPCVKIIEDKVVKPPCVKIIEDKVVKTPCVKIIEEKAVKTPCVEIIEEKIVKTPFVEMQSPCVELQTSFVETRTPCVEVPLQIPSYSYTDVSASQSELYGKGVEDSDDKFVDSYEQENYEMYEQMAMAYQSDVANQVSSTDQSGQARPIETVVRRRRGEIKCDWRAADNPAPATAPAPAPASATRPSRWGLKPGEVNIVLTGGPSIEPVAPVAVPAPTEQYPVVYKIQSLANRHDTSNTSIGYDEAYQVTYGASDRLQYGDCFGETPPASVEDPTRDAQGVKQILPSLSTLDERINRVLQETALGDTAKDTEDDVADREVPEKGILVTKLALSDPRTGKRVSFADGYKPGQDSDTEEPPVKRKKKSRRYGCAWPCPATHPDHVPLWDALPPPPPPRSPPPPPAAAPPPTHLLRPPPQRTATRQLKQDAAMSLSSFMPPEPPPGMITFQ